MLFNAQKENHTTFWIVVSFYKKHFHSFHILGLSSSVLFIKVKSKDLIERESC